MTEEILISESTEKDRLKWIKKMAEILDSRYKIPGTRFKFGIDPIIGLFPGLGDLITFMFSSMLVVGMIRNGASGKVVALMLVNILIDTLFGAIPVLGNVFDFFFKSNERNIRLLQEHYEEGKHQGSAKGVISIVLLHPTATLWSIYFLVLEDACLFFSFPK